jgi:hypothetical protein
MRRSKKVVLTSIMAMCLIGACWSKRAHLFAQSAEPGSKSLDLERKRRSNSKFRQVRAGELFDEDGLHLAITSYETSDGALLSVIHNEFASDVAAKAYFDKVLAKAARIVRRGEKRAGDGKIVGKRAEVVLQSNSANGQSLTIVFTYGANYVEIVSYSKSFGQSRRLEKWLTE